MAEAVSGRASKMTASCSGSTGGTHPAPAGRGWPRRCRLPWRPRGPSRRSSRSGRYVEPRHSRALTLTCRQARSLTGSASSRSPVVASAAHSRSLTTCDHRCRPVPELVLLRVPGRRVRRGSAAGTGSCCGPWRARLARRRGPSRATRRAGQVLVHQLRLQRLCRSGHHPPLAAGGAPARGRPATCRCRCRPGPQVLAVLQRLGDRIDHGPLTVARLRTGMPSAASRSITRPG